MKFWLAYVVTGSLAATSVLAQGETAVDKCLAIAGAANAGVPPVAVDAETQKTTLRSAADDCTAAASMDGAPPEVLFHAAAVAQARGNTDETLSLLTKAAALGLGPAETRLGDYYLFGVGGRPDVQQAVHHYEKAATLNDPAGMTTLALLHQVGQGVPRDTARMVALMKAASEAGYHFAQYRLAQVYLRGDGVPGRADPELGIPDVTRAAEYFAMAADNGNIAAALDLSALYADPSSGLAENPEEEVRLTRIVSRTGHAPAIAKMGVYYEIGRGVEHDPAVAAGLYVKALETGAVGFDALRAGAPARWDRETALAFQAILQERGLYRGPLDGIVGGGTAAAARGLVAN